MRLAKPVRNKNEAPRSSLRGIKRNYGVAYTLIAGWRRLIKEVQNEQKTKETSREEKIQEGLDPRKEESLTILKTTLCDYSRVPNWIWRLFFL